MAISDSEVGEYVDLREYISILIYRKWSVLVSLFLVAAAAVGFSLLQTPMYSSTAEVLVKSGTGSPVETSVQPNLETERRLALSQAVADLVAQDLLDQQEQEVGSESLSVRAEIDTAILTFSYASASPAEAQRLSQGFADAYLKFRRQQTLDDLLAASDSVQQRIQDLSGQLEGLTEDIAKTKDDTERAGLQTQANALIGQIAILQQELADLTPPENLSVGQVVTPAPLPESPSSPNHVTNLILGLALGLALGVGFAFLRERLDDRLRDKEDLERMAGAPVLAAVPSVPGWKRNRPPQLVTIKDPRSASAEAYRTLRTSVLFAMAQSNAKVILVTSPSAGDGKTTTVANLGVVLAQARKKVVLVSADLRRPRIHKYFDMEAHTGLTNVLAGEVSPWQAIKETGIDHLQILSSGAIPGNPAELLGSDAMGSLLASLAEVSDVVLVDAAPTLAVSDALAMVRLVDGVLVVADAETSHRGAVAQTRKHLEQVDAKIIGAVLNNFDPNRAGAYGYYGYGYWHYGGYEDMDETEKSGPRLLRRVGGR